MGITLDKNLFYRVRRGGGNPSSDLMRFEGGPSMECFAA
jgi:hypothetical protein